MNKNILLSLDDLLTRVAKNFYVATVLYGHDDFDRYLHGTHLRKYEITTLKIAFRLVSESTKKSGNWRMGRSWFLNSKINSRKNALNVDFLDIKPFCVTAKIFILRVKKIRQKKTRDKEKYSRSQKMFWEGRKRRSATNKEALNPLFRYILLCPAVLNNCHYM